MLSAGMVSSLGVSISADSIRTIEMRANAYSVTISVPAAPLSSRLR